MLPETSFAGPRAMGLGVILIRGGGHYVGTSQPNWTEQMNDALRRARA